MRKTLPSTSLCYKACAKYIPVLLCTIKLAQSTFHYYFVLQSLYYKACTKHVPVLLCTTQLAQSTSQYYFLLQSLHQALPSTTLYYIVCPYYVAVPLCTTKLARSTSYYKACTKYVPVLLCTTKLAQSTSQYYFVLQSMRKKTSQYFFVLHSLRKIHPGTKSLHKAHPTTTLSYRACTKHVPLLLCIHHQGTNQNYAHTTKQALQNTIKEPITHQNGRTANQAPCNIHAAITIRFAATSIHLCSHDNAIYNHRFQNDLQLRTHDETSIAKHHQGTRNQSHTKTNGPHPPRTGGTFHRRPKRLYTEKHKVLLRLPPQHKPHATFIQPLQCVLQQQVYIHAAITMRSATTDSKRP